MDDQVPDLSIAASRLLSQSIKLIEDIADGIIELPPDVEEHIIDVLADSVALYKRIIEDREPQSAPAGLPRWERRSRESRKPHQRGR